MKSGFDTSGGQEAGAAFSPPAIEEIARLFPQFEILGFIGKGGMGAVYQARQTALDRVVALKILAPMRAGDPGFTERFNREARTLARMSHPNIVAVHDFGTAGELSFLVMEFVDGANLREVVRAGRLAPAQALKIVMQICDALQFAHNAGVVHRDIKPENILLDRHGRVKITDFGIAKIVGALPEKFGLTGAKDIVGTPHYMAPEQLENPQTVDHRADIFSLGVVFYELLTGELPLGRFAPPSRKVQVDVRLDDVVLRALEKEPERRYQQAGHVKTDVEAITSGRPPIPGLPAAALATPGLPPNRKRKNVLVALAVVVVAFVVFTGLAVLALFLFWGQARVQTSGQKTVPPPATAVLEVSDSLRYQWQPGETYVYSVKAEATTDDYIETVTGNVIYTVRSTDGDKAALAYRSHLSPPTRRAKPGKTLPVSFPRGFGSFWADSPFGGMTREIQVDATGRVLSQSGGRRELPQALGDIERLVFEPMPPEGGDKWETSDACTVVLTTVERLSPMSPFGRKKEISLAARETARYQLAPKFGDTHQIRKRYELKTEETAGSTPRFSLTGEGTTTFDVALGRPRTMSFQGALSEATENTVSRTPLTLSYRLLDGAAKDSVLHPSAGTNDEPKELTASALAELVGELRSGSTARRNIALSRLANAKPTEPREEVVRALLIALDDSDWPARLWAAKALGTWGNADAVPPLVKLLDDPEFSVQTAAIDALGQLKHPDAAAPLARLLGKRASAGSLHARRALQAIGAPAEPAVIVVLQEIDREARYDACKVLKEIGTKQSVPALTVAAEAADSFARFLANEAIKAIEVRENPPQP